MWSGLYILSKSIVGRQLRKKVIFPNALCEFDVVVRKPGTRWDKFVPNYDPYHVLQCTIPRRLDKIFVAHQKLVDPETNKVLHVPEKDICTTLEVLKTFCPSGGNIFNSFAGTLTAAIACHKTGRACVCVEKVKRCFDLSVQHLFEVYKSIYGYQVDTTVLPPNRLNKATLSESL